MALIETWTSTGAETEKVFSSIPQTYTYLRLMILGRSQAAATATTLLVQFNGDTTAANYIRQVISAANGTVGGAYTVSDAGIPILIPAASYATVADAGFATMDVNYYRSTQFWKQCQMRHNHRTEDTGAGTFAYESRNQWRSTAAVNSIKVRHVAAENFLAGTIISLQGF